MHTLYIGVIGSGECSKEEYAVAQELGGEIARAKAVLVCGGLSGIMEGAARGAKMHNGTTIGILPGNDRKDANAYIDIAIPTGLGEARNVVLARTADCLIALPGEFGTLTEVAYGLKFGKPVLSLHSWEFTKEIIKVSTPQEAVEAAFHYAGQKR